MEWFKLYAEFASDPKVQSMPEPMQRRLIMLYCLRCSDDLGKLDDEEIALALRISPKELERTRVLFAKKGFIGAGWTLPKWEKRQAPADPTAAERMRRYRERQREQDRNVTRNETGPLRVEVEVEVETEVEAPRPPVVTSLGPEYQPVARYAEEQGGDVSWALWSDRMGRAGHPARSIRAALDEAAGNGKLNQGYVATILRRWAVEGEPAARNGTAPRRAEPVIRIHRKGDPL